MKNTRALIQGIKVFFAIVSLFTTTRIYGQTDKIVTSVQDFNLKIIGEAQREVNITLEATYSTKNNRYTLKFKNTNNDTTHNTVKEFSGPLNYEYFLMEFNDMFHGFSEARQAGIIKDEPPGDTQSATFKNDTAKQTSNAKKSSERDIVSKQSTESVFTWLYALKGMLEPQSTVLGKLHLRRYVKVIEETGKDRERMKDIETELDSMENIMYVNNARVKKAAGKVLGLIDNHIVDRKKQYQISVKKIADTTPLKAAREEEEEKKKEMEKDIAILESIKNEFLRSDYYFGIPEIKAFKGAVMEITDTIDRVYKDTIATRKYQDLLHWIVEYQKSLDTHQHKLKHFSSRKLYTIQSITLKIEKGFIEDIHVTVKNELNADLVFDNVIPIGVSSMNNIMSLGNVKLFIRKPKDEKGQKDDRFIYLFNVLGTFDVKEELQTRDYAPADTAINDLDPCIDRFIVFNRERRVRVFDSRIYSDLAGIDDKNPNGLLQIELAKRFNFITRRTQYGGNRADWGVFNYIYLYGALSKIEQKLRRLPLRNQLTVQNGSIVSPNYVTNLDLRKYENTSLGIDLNILTHNYKDGKFTLYADLGSRYGHIPVTDSLPVLNASGQLRHPAANEMRFLQGHTITLSPVKLRFEYISEKNIGFFASYQYNYTLLFSNNEFKQVMSDKKSDLSDYQKERRAPKSHQFCLEARLLTDAAANDNIFIRARFFLQHGDAQTFFPQIQVGYNYNFVFKK